MLTGQHSNRQALALLQAGWLMHSAAMLTYRGRCHIMQAAEFTAIREELYFLRPLKAKLAGLLFWMIVLLWFQVCARHD